MARTYRFQPRVSPETRAAIEEYAEVMGIPPNSAVSQLLEQAAPGLVDLTAAMRKANQSPARALREMAQAVHKATEEADQNEMDLTPKKKRKAS
jgi:DNA-binding LacI/PurR family transcriptional regulator